jgi:hypothetical protein
VKGTLVKYNAMCRAIAEAHAVDEAKEIRDQAVALEAYARQALNTNAEREAIEIRVRAERKVGQLLKVSPKATGTLKQGSNPPRSSGTTTGTTLKSLGISKDQSAKWQKLADMPDDDFELAIGTKTSKPSTNGILKGALPPRQRIAAPDALWLWGRLLDFERDGLLDKDPATVLESMTPEMLDDTHQLAPKVAAWLKRIGVLR